MKLIAASAFAVAALAASSALAQTQPPANPGPVIPGICAYSSQQLLATSSAGQAVRTRMQALETEVQGELNPYQTAIQTELQALQTSGASLPEAERNSRGQALQQRINEEQQLRGTRANELRYTLSEQLKKIEAAAGPIATAVYQERGCGVLLDADNINYINPAMDITSTVIQRLNQQLSTLSFNRMPVPAQAQQ